MKKKPTAPINLVDFCQDLLAGLQLGNEEKHQLVLVSSKVTSAILDQQLLHGILANLIVNAIKYSPNGGKVSLELDYCQKNEEDKSPILNLYSESLLPKGRL